MNIIVINIIYENITMYCKVLLKSRKTLKRNKSFRARFKHASGIKVSIQEEYNMIMLNAWFQYAMIFLLFSS